LLQVLTYSARVAKFVNSYPNIEVAYSVEDSTELTSSNPITINVTLDREADESDPNDQVADAPHYPHKKMVSWWLVIGDAATKQLYAIKKVTVKGKLETKLDFNLGQGDWKLKLYLICDSYSGADQDFDLETLKVAEGESSDEESSDEEDAMDQD
jgi:pre-mRNA-splicing helicase BRR2